MTIILKNLYLVKQNKTTSTKANQITKPHKTYRYDIIRAGKTLAKRTF